MNIDYQKKVADDVLKLLRTHDKHAILAGGAPRDWSLGKLASDLDFYFEKGQKWMGDIQDMLNELGLPSDCNEGDPQLYDRNPNILSVFSGILMDVPVQLICINIHPTDMVRQFALDICQTWYFDGNTYTTQDFDVAMEKKIIRITNNLYGDKDAYVQKIISKFPDFLFVGYSNQRVGW